MFSDRDGNDFSVNQSLKKKWAINEKFTEELKILKAFRSGTSEEIFRFQ